MNLKQHLQDDMKTALRSRDKERLGAIRLILAAVQQREVDERTELDDTQVLALLDKLGKQRRDSIDQYRAADRDDLAARETYELEVIQGYLPKALDEAELDALIDEAIAASGATSMRDMGQVMAGLKPRVQGRADMAAVSARVKARLSD
ncbi:MAG: GatB/YqeY domain-containing protein [Candidatus Competibacterales bacterium]|nr:GatB/YqeY domain-containing protein [Candidatus Competibacterales bacterium]